MNYFAHFDRYFEIALSAWEIFWCFAGGVWVCIILPSHTHIMHIMSEALYPGLCILELEGIM